MTVGPGRKLEREGQLASCRLQLGRQGLYYCTIKRIDVHGSHPALFTGAAPKPELEPEPRAPGASVPVRFLPRRERDVEALFDHDHAPQQELGDAETLEGAADPLADALVQLGARGLGFFGLGVFERRGGGVGARAAA